MKIWMDTEFIEDGHTIELISIGMIREDGLTYYAEPYECDLSRASQWVKDNVLPHLSGVKAPRKRIAEEIIAFAGPHPQFWTYYGSYDWVVLCQLFGTMMDLPTGWPMFPMDIEQSRTERGVKELPEQSGPLHNALADAIWTRDAYFHIYKEVAVPIMLDVTKFTAANGETFYCKDVHSEVDMRTIVQRIGKVIQIERIQMTESDYNAIPATNESARVFGK